ncbi:glycerophosphoryl diester phosphodiesterase [Niabella beijingensis]|uniref:glycerophosphoryl diester phosphodiesterase n=1 Tax=Niabella beijingensis TaxID=2872700 RepID=UPI001CBF4A72|nr:glycerophosphoryl diester phosphodiesterase [Niabella beijingensis]MBZ4189290.1 glycerophosphoryl diester phosphodiesterase [Niabella beijingensis]
MKHRFLYLFFLLLLSGAVTEICGQQAPYRLKNGRLGLEWQKTGDGFMLKKLEVYKENKWVRLPGVLGQYTLLYAADQPGTAAGNLTDAAGKTITFPEPEYRYVIPKWKEATSAVSLNREGTATVFYPSFCAITQQGLVFRQQGGPADLKATWELDPANENDIKVTLQLVAHKAGYYSIASPALFTGDKDRFSWAIIPGIFQGNRINNNFVDAYAYGHGVPALPVVARERTAAALTSILTTKEGVTLSVTAAPGTGRDPWAGNKLTQSDWLLGLSMINRQGQLTPTLYHPVLGQKKSFLNPGDTVTFEFRYTVTTGDWYQTYQHVVNDIYRFDTFLQLKKSQEPLSDRISKLFHYVRSDSTSRWRVFDYKGMHIGAQEYLGGVYESEKDAVKNADYGAMWMLAHLTRDPVLLQKRLPEALNFKLAQQHTAPGFFKGAAAGQYYLYKSRRFTEEWGPYTEPIGTTYYLMLDIGNILLFEPDQPALKKELRQAADWLLEKMHPEGFWEVAYDNASHRPLFEDLKDYRPTFYGLLVAYKLLGDKKFLHAAIKAADWFIKNSVEQGFFLGVCGDTRFAPDFATGQSAQALLDLYEITKTSRYRQAAIQVAELYTTSVYSHPIPSTDKKQVEQRSLEDWQISQVGLSFEHGGIIGSANGHGPILLASHAGLFVRMFQLTKDSLFLKMARTAALGREAFVDAPTGVASYYWTAMNKGAGPYPHHAWWQVGWITDYLMAELSLRSNGQISFPAGFLAPKVGPHKTYGFSSGKIYGNEAELVMTDQLVTLNNPNIDYLCAIDRRTKKVYLFLLNNDDETQTTDLNLSQNATVGGIRITPGNAELLSEGKRLPAALKNAISIAPYGLRVYRFDYR